MSDLFDDWLTTEPDDECCADHGRRLPCAVCAREAAEEWAERRREDPHG